MYGLCNILCVYRDFRREKHGNLCLEKERISDRFINKFNYVSMNSVHKHMEEFAVVEIGNRNMNGKTFLICIAMLFPWMPALFRVRVFQRQTHC